MFRSTYGPAAATDSPGVHVRLAVEGIRLEFGGRRSFFEQHVASLVEAMYARVTAGETVERAEDGPVFVPSSPQQFRQFASQVGARAATVEQRIMAFAFFLWNYEKKNVFNAGDVLEFFGTVRENPPEDLDRRFENLADAKRFLIAGREAKTWRLTPKGVNYVKNRLLGAM